MRNFFLMLVIHSMVFVQCISAQVAATTTTVADVVVYFPDHYTESTIQSIRIGKYNNAQELGVSRPSGCRLWRVTLPFHLPSYGGTTLISSVSQIIAQGTGTGTGGGNNPSAVSPLQSGGNATVLSDEDYHNFANNFASNPYQTSTSALTASAREGFDDLMGKYLSLGYTFLCPQTQPLARSLVKIAIIDSGVNTNHPYFVNSNTAFSNTYNAINDNTDVTDRSGHGTHIAATIAAQIKDAAHGSIKIMPIKVLDNNGAGKVFDIIKGIDFAVTNGADIINLSLTFRGTIDVHNGSMPDALAHTISMAISRGSIVVCAAGNQGSNSQANYPAGYANIHNLLVVGSLKNHQGSAQISSFSNYGLNVDVFAPGENIVAPTLSQGLLNPNSPPLYANLNGTSMASGFVSGSLGLLLTNTSLTPEDIETYLQGHLPAVPDLLGRERNIFDLSGFCDTEGRLLRMGKPSLPAIQIFPNPTPSNVEVALDIEEDNTALIWSFVAVDGKIIHQGDIAADKGRFNLEIKLPEDKGCYYLVINKNGATSSYPIIKI